MYTFTENEARDWCKALQFEFDDDGRLCVPRGGHTYRVDLSKMPWRRLLHTAYALAFLGHHDARGFYGGLVWVRRTGIAVPEMEEVVMRALERFRLGYGESRSLETARAHSFRRDESAEYAAVLLLVLLAEWDAYVFHESGDWVALIDHDGHITVTAKSAKIAADLRTSLEVWGTNYRNTYSAEVILKLLRKPGICATAGPPGLSHAAWFEIAVCGVGSSSGSFGSSVTLRACPPPCRQMLGSGDHLPSILWEVEPIQPFGANYL